jgi:hypothetical protein
MLVTLSEKKFTALQGALSNLLLIFLLIKDLILGLSSKRSLSSIRYRSTLLKKLAIELLAEPFAIGKAGSIEC